MQALVNLVGNERRAICATRRAGCIPLTIPADRVGDRTNAELQQRCSMLIYIIGFPKSIVFPILHVTFQLMLYVWTATMRWTSFILLTSLLVRPSAGQQVERDTSSTHSAVPYVLGGVAALTAICLVNDQQISDDLFAWKQRHVIVKDLSPIVTLGGEALFAYGLFGGLGAYGYVADDPGMIEVAKIGVVAVTGTGIAAQVLKRLFGRERPTQASRPRGDWHGPALFTPFDSFPSGHSTTAFTVATVLTDMHEDTPWIGYAAYPLAGAVALSRITERKHWASDVIVGALLGTYGTKIIMYTIRSSSIISVFPRFSSHSVGLSAQVRFL
jgi:membrane-associated phospholipid phosphatase